jgi:hypothetical protein
MLGSSVEAKDDGRPLSARVKRSFASLRHQTHAHRGPDITAPYVRAVAATAPASFTATTHLAGGYTLTAYRATNYGFA